MLRHLSVGVVLLRFCFLADDDYDVVFIHLRRADPNAAARPRRIYELAVVDDEHVYADILTDHIDGFFSIPALLGVNAADFAACLHHGVFFAFVKIMVKPETDRSDKGQDKKQGKTEDVHARLYPQGQARHLAS